MKTSNFYNIDSIYSKLFQALISNCTLQAIISLASNLIDSPLVLLDSSYGIMAHSDIDFIKDDIWKQNIKLGYCTYEFIVKVNTLPSVKKGKSSNSTYIAECNESSSLKLVSKIKVNKVVIGTLIMFAYDRAICDDDYKIIDVISKTIETYCKMNEQYKKYTIPNYKDFLYDILDDKKISHKKIETQLKLNKISFPNEMCAVVFDTSKFEFYKYSLEELNKRLSSYFSDYAFLFYKDHFIAISDWNSISDLSYKYGESLAKNKIYVGISSSFSNILDLRKYYLQCLKSIELGRIAYPNKHIIFYSSVQYYELLDNIDTNKDYSYLCLPSLKILKEYDTKHNSNLYETLYIYILNDGNVQKTANKLFLHRNTIRYKIDKIKSLIKIDFSNMSEISNVFLSYRILNFLDAKKIN